jgi:hypothetical protein
MYHTQKTEDGRRKMEDDRLLTIMIESFHKEFTIRIVFLIIQQIIRRI